MDHAAGWGSQRAYARHRATTHRAVQKAIEAGRISEAALKRDDAGRVISICFAQADAEWLRNTDPLEALKNGKLITPPEPAAAPAAADQVLDDSRALEAEAFYAERAKRMKFDAATAEIDYLERVGQLVSVKQVEDQVFGIFRQVRDRLQNIPARVGPRLAAETDPARVDRMLSDEIRLVLDELSRDVDGAATAGPS